MRLWLFGFPVVVKSNYKMVDLVYTDGVVTRSKTYYGGQIRTTTNMFFSVFYIVVPFACLIFLALNASGDKKLLSFYTLLCVMILLSNAYNTYSLYFFVFGLLFFTIFGIYITSKGNTVSEVFGSTIMSSFAGLFSAFPLMLSGYTSLSWHERDVNELVLWFLLFCSFGFIVRYLSRPPEYTQQEKGGCST